MTYPKLAQSAVNAAEQAAANATDRGFRAHLQGVKLHDLVMLQRLARASGVFVVLAGDRSGFLHFSCGELWHAEADELTGDAAALEILGWADGEFVTSERPISELRSVTCSLETLLLSRVGDPPERQQQDSIDVNVLDGTLAFGGKAASATGIRRRSERADSAGEDGVTAGEPPSSALPPAPPSRRGSHHNEAAAAQAGTSPGESPPESSRLAAAAGVHDIAAAATPGVAAVVPRGVPRGADMRGAAHVVVSPRGELLDGHGPDPEGLAARVAYMARLAELIGQAMGSGESRSIRVRGAEELYVRRYPDGTLSGALSIPEAGDVAPSASSSAPGARTSGTLPPPSTRTPR